MKVVSSTDTRLISGGHSTLLEAGVPVEIPDVFAAAAAEHPDVTISDGAEEQSEPEGGISITEAVMAILTDGDDSEVTGSGRPKVAAIKRRTGLNEVSAEDIDKALLELE